MQIPALMLLLCALLLTSQPAANGQSSTPTAAKQLFAVRGEVVKKAAAAKGWLRLTVKPLKDYAEVTVLARDNDLVGHAVNRSQETSLLGLLAEGEGDDERITAVEIEEGDIVSVIYDPQAQNRALEIYIY